MKLIMEGWREFLSKARKKSKPKDDEPEPPSSVVTALMNRGGLSREEAEKMATKQMDLEEADDLLLL